jgi:hypothetical protein
MSMRRVASVVITKGDADNDDMYARCAAAPAISSISISAPAKRLGDKTDMVVYCVIVAAVEKTASGNEVVFVRETWFWRHAKEEPPSMLESGAGRWLHNLVGSWMIFKGTSKVTAPVKAKKE